MIINDLYIKGIAVGKGEAKAPLVVNANAPLPRSIAAELFQPIARRYAQIFYNMRRVQQRQLLGGALLEIARHSAYFQTGKNGGGVLVSKRLNHGSYFIMFYVKRQAG